jgi:hypothetical protein
MPSCDAPKSLVPSGPAEEDIRAELSRILASHEFRTSKRSADFLRYVVENTLNGHVELLRERTIGMEVFGRTAAYDPSEDATVRVKASEVRKRLGLYYSGEGRANAIRIELPAGTYVPEFRLAPITPAGNSDAPQTLPRLQSRINTLWMVVPISALLLVTAAGTFVWVKKPAIDPVLAEFWSPVLQGAVPVSLCASFVPDVYGLNTKRPARSRPLEPKDFVLLPDQFVGGGDMIAVSRLSSMLARMGRAYQLRVGGEVTLHDFEETPAVLVGYSYTRWKEISSELRYFIDASRRPVGITDNGSATKWTLPELPADRHSSEDYAIVTRVFHPDTHAMLVELAGILQYGTDAAANLVTNPELLAEAVRGAPPGWSQKNLQLVLHVKVISGVPSSPKVVAAYFW